MSNFFTLNIARRAMQTSTQALEVTSHNVANASTRGFSRQRAEIQSTRPHMTPAFNMPGGAGQIGTGVEVAAITRARSEMLDLQVRGQNSALGYWQSKGEALDYLSGVFMEPSDNGLNTAMEAFWASWNEVAKNPSSEAARTSLLESANSLCSSFQSLSTQTTNLLEDVNHQTELKVAEINDIAENIASLNAEIVSARGAGYQPNDLMDKRDLLLDDLSRLADVGVHQQDSGSVYVSLGGKVLVQDTKVMAMETQEVNGKVVAAWERDGSQVNTSQGELAGLADLHDFIKDDVLGGLNELARGLADAVNDLHTDPSGYDLNGNPGGEFFTIPTEASGQEAAYIQLATGLQDNPEAVVAAGSEGTNEIALAMAELRNATPMSGGLTSFHNFFSGLVTDLGFEAKTSENMAVNHQIMQEHSEARRQAETGVSIDEEVTYMIQFQHTYQAAAQVISTTDSLLNTLINEMGRR